MTTETKTLKVVGERTMHCGGCENTVKFALQQLPGVQEVEATHKTQLINLTFDPQTLNLKQVLQELDWIGYQVVEASES
jgi:copper chaperone CopZ